MGEIFSIGQESNLRCLAWMTKHQNATKYKIMMVRQHCLSKVAGCWSCLVCWRKYVSNWTNNNNNNNDNNNNNNNNNDC